MLLFRILHIHTHDSYRNQICTLSETYHHTTLNVQTKFHTNRLHNPETEMVRQARCTAQWSYQHISIPLKHAKQAKRISLTSFACTNNNWGRGATGNWLDSWVRQLPGTEYLTVITTCNPLRRPTGHGQRAPRVNDWSLTVTTLLLITNLTMETNTVAETLLQKNKMNDITVLFVINCRDQQLGFAETSVCLLGLQHTEDAELNLLHFPF